MYAFGRCFYSRQLPVHSRYTLTNIISQNHKEYAGLRWNWWNHFPSHLSVMYEAPLSIDLLTSKWNRSEESVFCVVENEKLGLCLIPGLQRRARIRFNIRFSHRSSAVHISVWDATAIYQQTFIFSGAGLREHWVFKVKSRAESIRTAGAEAPNASN